MRDRFGNRGFRDDRERWGSDDVSRRDFSSRYDNDYDRYNRNRDAGRGDFSAARDRDDYGRSDVDFGRNFGSDFNRGSYGDYGRNSDLSDDYGRGSRLPDDYDRGSSFSGRYDRPRGRNFSGDYFRNTYGGGSDYGREFTPARSRTDYGDIDRGPHYGGSGIDRASFEYGRYDEQPDRGIGERISRGMRRMGRNIREWADRHDFDRDREREYLPQYHRHDRGMMYGGERELHGRDSIFDRDREFDGDYGYTGRDYWGGWRNR